MKFNELKNQIEKIETEIENLQVQVDIKIFDGKSTKTLENKIERLEKKYHTIVEKMEEINYEETERLGLLDG